MRTVPHLQRAFFAIVRLILGCHYKTLRRKVPSVQGVIVNLVLVLTGGIPGRPLHAGELAGSIGH